jgi:serine/threonine protein kinase
MVNSVACLETDTLAALLESESSEALNEFGQHLETCACCQQVLADLCERRWHPEELMRSLPPANTLPLPSEPALTRVMMQLKSELALRPAGAEENSHEPEEALAILTPTDQPLLLGTLGGYDVETIIGRGGMGVVFQAFDPVLERKVAIKVMASAATGTATARRRFIREARAAAAVSHEHIVAVHGVHEAGGLPYLVMQYVAGESLQDYLDRAGPLEMQRAVRIACETALGLAAAHAHGLIHRDIKPANLLLENGGSVKITDFGLARTTEDAALTQAGVVAGTPEYMAPEQARGEAVDQRADLFSLGCVLYALVTGQPPFRAATPLAVLRQVSDEAPCPVRSINPQVPAWLEELLARLLAKSPQERIQSAAELATLLQGYLGHLQQPELVSPPELPPLGSTDGKQQPGAGPAKRWTFRLLCLLGLVLLGAIGLGLPWLLGHDRDTRPASPPGQALFQDFRQSRPLVPGLALVGKNVEQFLTREPQGYRFSLPAGRKVEGFQTGVGVQAAFPIKGDFQITGAYVLLAADTPVRKMMVAGVEMFIMRSPDGKRQARLGLFHTTEGPVYEVRDSDFTPPRKPNPVQIHRFPTQEHRGQLRLLREGTKLSYLVKDAATNGAFKELYKVDFGSESLTALLFGVTPGMDYRAVEGRLIDLRIQPGSKEPDVPLPGTQPAEPPVIQPEQSGSPPRSPGRPRAQAQPPEESRDTEASLRWPFFLMIGLVILLGAGVLIAILRIQRRNRKVAAAAGQRPLRSATTAPPLTFACSICGKRLKSRAELAGQKVKCPRCGKAVGVPG